MSKDAAADAELAAALTAVGAQLAALAAASPTMPADVVARLEAALSAAASPESGAGVGVGSVTTLPVATPPRWRSSWLASGVAASVVLLLIGAVVVGVVTQKDRAQTTTASALNAKGASGPKLAASNRDYTPATLTKGVLDLLAGLLPPAGSLAPLSGAAPQVAAASGGPANGTNSRGSAVVPGVPGNGPGNGTGNLQGPAAAITIDPGCLSALTGGPSIAPIGIDAARWKGEPAFVVVVASSRARLFVFVVGRGCSAHDQQVRYFSRIARPT